MRDQKLYIIWQCLTAKMYWILLEEANNYYAATAANLLQSCPTLCDPIDCSPPGSPIPGILQAKTLEWVAISLITIVIIN